MAACQILLKGRGSSRLLESDAPSPQSKPWFILLARRIQYVPRKEEKSSRVEKGECDGKDEGGRGEGGVIRTRDESQLCEEHWH